MLNTGHVELEPGPERVVFRRSAARPTWPPPTLAARAGFFTACSSCSAEIQELQRDRRQRHEASEWRTRREQLS
jgi:hypothetical protein